MKVFHCLGLVQKCTSFKTLSSNVIFRCIYTLQSICVIKLISACHNLKQNRDGQIFYLMSHYVLCNDQMPRLYVYVARWFRNVKIRKEKGLSIILVGPSMLLCNWNPMKD